MPSENDWSQTREAIRDQINRWIDTVGETEHGQQQLALMLAHMDSHETPAPSIPLPDASPNSRVEPALTVPDEVVASSLRGLDEITQDLTALRHELKLNTKQSRSFSDVLASDAQRIVAASDKLLDQLSQNAIPPTSAGTNSPEQASTNSSPVSETARSAVMAIVEVDEALSRLSNAHWAALRDCPTPPSPATGGWFGRRSREQHDQLWQATWQSRKQTLEGLAEGLRLTTQRMSHQLATLKVQRIGEAGEPFDPHTMQVLEVESSTQHPVGTVLRVLRTGYQQGTWLIRPAQVVTANP